MPSNAHTFLQSLSRALVLAEKLSNRMPGLQEGAALKSRRAVALNILFEPRKSLPQEVLAGRSAKTLFCFARQATASTKGILSTLRCARLKAWSMNLVSSGGVEIKC